MPKFVFLIKEPIVRYFEIVVDAANEHDAEEEAWRVLKEGDCQQIDSYGLWVPMMELIEIISDPN